ncbi:MAG TPA: AraC family transcriptional regulator [Marinilabiliales bacterium]|nr:AraC family transcriptional regulator [Salinivirgaceae bacterium]OFX46471.1 MAG: AraC family transcriptional regulator [Bacteroidetes bacterium GWA2_40_14]OFX73638.1 MAG: AraC family transcriptional regulator [Bacteroidetes bacterium GWD2_40_43]OFX88474.1 MAG: AraC family transcriptional regulator [Bacteroidetes bacterium GWE2_40_63]OFY22632.1 MAG: AraC family transcriptional regulator [Bacteroidetes bacterium GWF2_40_13]OFZ29554.1 MAG: AraC family transcriptional regulator [Bacteroidetes b
MQYFIKNMVCNRCIMVVKNVFENLGYPPVHIALGEVVTSNPMDTENMEKLKKQLLDYGFELIDDTKSRIIERIKNTIVSLIHHNTVDLKVNYSQYIESQLNKDYSYLSSLFSEVEGTTIEKYIIHQKIEKVKELLVYDELTLSEIAYKMGYGSVAYLSSQFKKVTGLTPSHFKQVKENKRKPLDEV